MLRVSGLAKRLPGFAVEQITFEVGRGDYFVLLGASGVGKTLVLELLAGLIAPDAGKIELDGRDVTHARMQDRGFGLVYQDQALFPHLDVFRNIAYGMNGRGLTRAAIRDKVSQLAEEIGLTDLLHRYPGTLSGGEAQRVALARTLAIAPKCLLLDEPLSSLDYASCAGLRRVLRTLHQHGQTVVHVTHDYEEALSLATHVGVMEKGAIAQTGTPQEVFHHPRTEFVARFAGIHNAFPGILEPLGETQGIGCFRMNDLTFQVLTEAAPGPGQLVFRSEDVTLSQTPACTSAQNMFLGVVRDVFPARLGMEILVDIGVEIAALVTADSVERCGLRPGQEVWASVKASAARFIPE